EPQELAEDDAQVLRVAHRVASGAAVAEAEVEVAVGTEDDVAAVVVVEGLLDGEEDGFGSGVQGRASVAALHSRERGAEIGGALGARRGVREVGGGIGGEPGGERGAKHARLGGGGDAYCTGSR